MSFYKNKTALITGASSGIGWQLSLDLAAEGAIPLLVARRKDRMEELAELILQDYGITAPIFVADLSREHEAAALFKKTTDAGFHVDILVNNAGFGYKGPFLQGDASTYRNMTLVNMTALTELTYFYLPGMVQKNTGGILNMASMAGMAPIPYFAVYAATKSYVNSFGCALWHELKTTGVHVSTICPGPVETEFAAVAGASASDAPARTVQTADEISEIALQALRKNYMLVPTSTALKIMNSISTIVPLKTTMNISAIFMKEKKP